MYTKKLTTKQIILKILLYFVVIDICIFTLYPYFAMFCSALKSRAEIFSVNGTILPVEPMWSNFIDVWKRAPLAQYAINFTAECRRIYITCNALRNSGGICVVTYEI